jgi:hypothetical protein
MHTFSCPDQDRSCTDPLTDPLKTIKDRKRGLKHICYAGAEKLADKKIIGNFSSCSMTTSGIVQP